MDFDKFCLIVIGVIFVIALLFGVGIPSILGNRSLVDTKFKYNKAIVNSGEETIEIEIDENGNPVMPEGWTFLIHGSSLDRWDETLLGND